MITWDGMKMLNQHEKFPWGGGQSKLPPLINISTEPVSTVFPQFSLELTLCVMLQDCSDAVKLNAKTVLEELLTEMRAEGETTCFAYAPELCGTAIRIHSGAQLPWPPLPPPFYATYLGYKPEVPEAKPKILVLDFKSQEFAEAPATEVTAATLRDALAGYEGGQLKKHTLWSEDLEVDEMQYSYDEKSNSYSPLSMAWLYLWGDTSAGTGAAEQAS